jgi:hypothetical protein
MHIQVENVVWGAEELSDRELLSSLAQRLLCQILVEEDSCDLASAHETAYKWDLGIDILPVPDGVGKLAEHLLTRISADLLREAAEATYLDVVYFHLGDDTAGGLVIIRTEIRGRVGNTPPQLDHADEVLPDQEDGLPVLFVATLWVSRPLHSDIGDKYHEAKKMKTYR